MTIVTHLPNADPDPSLPATLPDFGLDLTEIKHLWHPRTWTNGNAAWSDSVGQIALPKHGDASIVKTVEDGRPILDTTTTATFVPGDIFDEVENATLLIIARVATADGISGGGYIIHNGRDGITMPVPGTNAVTFTNGAPATTAELDKWHLFSVTTPAAGFSRFTVDTLVATATGGVADNKTVRVGANNTINKRDMSVAMVLACTELPAAVITGTVFPLVKEWFPAFDWAV